MMQRCIGDEFHYVLECSKLKSFRAKYLPSVYTIRPNVLKFANLLGSDNHTTLINLTIFLKVSNVLQVTLNEILLILILISYKIIQIYSIIICLSVYLYMFICLSVYIYICMCMYVCMHVCVYMCVYVYIYMYVYIYIYVCIYMYVYVCVYVCICVCVYVYMCVSYKMYNCVRKWLSFYYHLITLHHSQYYVAVYGYYNMKLMYVLFWKYFTWHHLHISPCFHPVPKFWFGE